MYVVASVAHTQAIPLALLHAKHRLHAIFRKRDVVDGPPVEAAVGRVLFGKGHFKGPPGHGRLQVPGLSSTIQGQGPSVMLNMFFVRALLILCVILVCTLMVSDIGPAVFLLAFAGWGLMEWAGVFRASGDTHQGPED